MRRQALAAALLLAAAPASAHVRLVWPTSRYGDEMKAGPCGRLGGTRTTTVSSFLPGQAITVIFDEIIDHPGYFRIAFDPGGDGALQPPVWDAGTATWSNPPGVLVLADRIPDAVGLTHGEVLVTLPDLECSTCTLQLIQVMIDKPPYDGLDDFYYQCADLLLSATATPTPPGTTPSGSPTPPPPAPAPAAPPAGGCGTPGAAGAAAGLGPLLALAAGLRRRRPRPA